MNIIYILRYCELNYMNYMTDRLDFFLWKLNIQVCQRIFSRNKYACDCQFVAQTAWSCQSFIFKFVSSVWSSDDTWFVNVLSLFTRIGNIEVTPFTKVVFLLFEFYFFSPFYSSAVVFFSHLNKYLEYSLQVII